MRGDTLAGMSFWALLFWFSAAGLFYIYAGYPLLIGLLARVRARPVRKAPNRESISIILSAYQEGPRVAGKVREVLAADGADRIVQILVGFDGGAEPAEVETLRELDARVEVLSFPARRGKPSVLNDLIPRAKGTLLVLMDVRQRLDARALTALAANFSSERCPTP